MESPVFFETALYYVGLARLHVAYNSTTCSYVLVPYLGLGTCIPCGPCSAAAPPRQDEEADAVLPASAKMASQQLPEFFFLFLTMRG